MRRSIDSARMDELILARLFVQTKKPPTLGVLKKSLQKFVEHILSPGEWRTMLDESISRLKEEAYISPTSPLQLTEKGEKRLENTLGLSGNVQWRTVQSLFLPAKTLGLSPNSKKIKERLNDAKGLRASILREQHSLAAREAPTLNQSIDALVWRELGRETNEPLTPKKMRMHILQKLLGKETRLSIEKLQNAVVADAIDASRADTNSLRTQLVRNWLSPEEPAATPEQQSAVQTAESALSLEEFAARVREAASTATTGRFGDRKVFISAVWRSVKDTPALARIGVEEFKELLVSANRAGLLVLHRADLVGAMSQEEVRASETSYLNATFHFIESEQRRPA